MDLSPVKKTKFVAVIGGNECSAQEMRLAEDVGREIARQGAVLICGGLGGIMEAACRGARQENGTTVGIVPGEKRESANQYVTIPIASGIGHARNMIVAKSADAVIAIGGGYGTLAEIAYALQGGIPVISLNTWTLSRNGQVDRSIIPAADPGDAVSRALDLD